MLIKTVRPKINLRSRPVTQIVGNGKVAGDGSRKRNGPVRKVTVEKVVASTSAMEGKRLMLMIEAVEYGEDDEEDDEEDETIRVCRRFNV